MEKTPTLKETFGQVLEQVSGTNSGAKNICYRVLSKKAAAMLKSADLPIAASVEYQKGDAFLLEVNARTFTLDQVIDMTERNRSMLANSQSCGCCYCGQIFSPSEIIEWWKKTKMDAGYTTAVCPHCKIDGVIAEHSDGLPELNYRLLKFLKQELF